VSAIVHDSGFFTPKNELRWGIAAGVLLAAGFVLSFVASAGVASAGLVYASLAIGMVFGMRAAMDALTSGKFDIDVLMIVAAALAAYIGHAAEGALLLFLFTLSGALEGLALERTQREVSQLHKLVPPDAMVKRGSEWVTVRAESLVAGEAIKVRPGERVPADARVTSGRSAMDQSALTGESMPRTVSPGDELLAGTINLDDALEGVVIRPAQESGIQQVLRLVTQAAQQRPPVQRLIDRLDQPYSIGVLGLSIVVFLVWWLVLKRPAIGSDAQPGAMQTAITFLIVASPCALVIATPTATLAGLARAARGGVLCKGGQALERLAGVRAMCFDKTGTLTHGRPSLYEVHPVAWSNGPELLRIAIALEQDSTHPIAAAIREAGEQRGLSPAEVSHVDHVTARGLEGVLSDGSIARLGRYSFVEEVVPVCLRGRTRELLEKVQQRGHIAVVVARAHPADKESGQAAVLLMADSVRPGAEEMVRELHAMGVRPLRMLTGDNRFTAQRVAESLKLDSVDAELMPGDKLRIVGQMQDAGARVGVIGDGVNDAPVLAASDAGIAMGTIGTSAAMESADVVLLTDGLSPVAWVIGLARKTQAIVRANIVFALVIIGAMAASTLFGSWIGKEIPVWVGVLSHEGGTVLVVLNSLRILGLELPKRGHTRPDMTPDTNLSYS
jgi:Cd2+/Zn2+-exporting ATPase